MTLRRFPTAGLASIAALTLFSSVFAWAQDTQGPITPKPGASVQQSPNNAIRVRVQLVNAPVVVTDAKGNLISDLQQKDFHVFDNGVAQTIESFDLGGAPLSVVLLFETSFRIAPLIPAIQKSAIVFTQ